MCGLIGFAGKHDPVNISAGAKHIRRRGPDGLGVWKSEDQRVQIIHSLLSISDTAPAGKQPMSDPPSGLVLAFNGEIYNHREIRRGMTCAWTTGSDTETLLKLFAHRGLNALTDLRGMFAIILVDMRSRNIVLMRDPIGKKPLFILRRPEGTYFGSSVVSLAVAANHKTISETNAKRWWELGYSPPDVALIEGCTPLFPGEVVKLDWNGAVTSRERVTPRQPKTIKRISVFDAILEVESRLRVAVDRRLANNPKPVALLSGGIDSTVVCKLASEAGHVRLVTCEPSVFRSVDSKFASEAAKRLGAPLEILPLKIQNISAAVEQAICLQDEPLGMISFVPLALMSKLAATESRVLLTGDGGDEAFCGYGRPEVWVAKSTVAETDFKSGPNLPGWMSEYAHRACGHDLVGHGLAKVDRATAEQAIEARSPMLDWDVLEFVRTLPKDIVLLSQTTNKPLAKALLYDWPQSFVERTKAGFPFRLRALWALVLYSGLREVIRPDAVELFRRHLPRPLRNAPLSWSSYEIGNNFNDAFKLYVWSAFLSRIEAN